MNLPSALDKMEGLLEPSATWSRRHDLIRQAGAQPSETLVGEPFCPPSVELTLECRLGHRQVMHQDGPSEDEGLSRGNDNREGTPPLVRLKAVCGPATRASRSSL
jgi:hypothetical protein